jgi:hypothetical protein
VFAARVPDGNTGLSEGGDGQSLSLLSLSRAPGTIPSHVNPPRAPSDNLLLGAPEEPKLVAVPAAPAPAPTRVANAAPTAQNDGFFSSLARKVGIGGSADATASTPPPAAPAKPKVIEAKRSEPAPRPEAVAPKPKAEPKQAASRPPLKPSVSDTPAAAAPATKDSQVAGSAPIVSSNSFDSRFGAMK